MSAASRRGVAFAGVARGLATSGLALSGVAALTLLASAFFAPSAGAQSDVQEDKPPGSAAPPPSVDMNRLLKLPGSFDQPPKAKGGVTLDEWQARFDQVLVDLYTANRELARAQTELEEMAVQGGQWSMAAPGTQASSENSPVSFKLRQEVRRQREAVERSERRLRELEVEADLAGVPADWRRAHALPITDPKDSRLRRGSQNL